MTGHVVELVEDYLTLRHDLGYHSPGQDSYLRCFAAWLDRAGHRGPIPLAATIGWATATRSPDPCNPARRLATVRGFLRHLAGIDAATEVPPMGFLGPVGQRKPPHIYTDAEIADLLRAAGALAPPGGLRPHSYVTLLGLLACTGLRIGEALALSCADVDLTEGVLTVRAGKRGRTRLVPLHPTAIAPLRDYTNEREQRYGPPPGDAAFFRTDRSDHIDYRSAQSTFQGLRRQLGWTASGRTRAPRIHDLRHRMVVRRVQAWHADGADVDGKIAVLATYVGHVEIYDVYWYLSAVPELMSIVGDRFDAFAGRPAGAS